MEPFLTLMAFLSTTNRSGWPFKGFAPWLREIFREIKNEPLHFAWRDDGAFLWPELFLFRGERGRFHKRQASSSLVISPESGTPLLPNWHRLTANKGFLAAGKAHRSWHTLQWPALQRPQKGLAGVIQGTPDPLTKEMESWCLFNENNKARELNTSRASLCKGSLGRMDGGLHLKWLSRVIIRCNFLKNCLFHVPPVYNCFSLSKNSDIYNTAAGFLPKYSAAHLHMNSIWLQ